MTMELKLSQWDFITADYWHTREEVASEYNKFSNQEINDLVKFLEQYHNPANENISWR